MNILYLHGVSSFGGSTKSLLELYTQLKLLGVQGTALCPKGYSQKALLDAGMKTYSCMGVSQFDNTLYSHYKGLRWIILLRELVYLLPTICALLKIKLQKNHFDIIHANEITLLPIATIAKKLFKCPLIVHVRSVQRGDAKDRRTKWLFNFLKKKADAIVAIDETVKGSLPQYLTIQVIHNGINLPENIPAKSLVAGNELPKVGIVGMLLRLKGIYEYLEAARILIQEKQIKAQFVVVGENARSSKGLMAWVYKKLGFSDDIMGDMLAYIKQHQLENYFTVKGFVKDVRSIYSDLDILCFPSYLNAAGRPVFEAALYGIPSIVAISDPKSDTIIDNETGLCIKSACAASLANAIDALVTNPDERMRLGINAQKQAFLHFDIKANAKKMVTIYNNVLGAPPLS
ncbi:glycosyltransferase family 4 protein [Legionella waltersii]|uniref:CapM protein, capsular polysaccharide biosynthesis n=1 Tax=Legionella waltersii TaxID=66969 RepID=A0A0W1AN20_9GAMM|nr:glycosyltransferase family 4 protein [Legionella waltersii]KTD82737.1 CapM protein, capsular polysaccharide biosynthesis [Legionella waltersii]SNV01005.1 CapM protein, capsular polysaccharide biosynthesis [Legionella waltersii]